ncbi:hypothetical protein LPB142_16260 [Rhodobacter xanthinilyticus]|uniref:Acyltransferase n=1 Tax=Rhodobacter xanthinilyticus TaxID=1850250 RepID=A0A1D9MFQ1_9RHOB|nr:acyltransferase family protein [Rhodobacter xanthinilyticus]AOZ70694.1 hypothetical protein LPB142_16260 [Rhodobacter xanthinilyticus]
MRYRPEIDGLRTLAVMPVILFHAGLPGFGGGFVGVDVFFVISGFLITRILADDIDAGRYSLLEFYERRARRILPALFLVMALSFAAAWFLMLPRPFLDFARSQLAVAVFASNIEFWRQTGYFETLTVTKPLLHTWSLAVEEQFYIAFPLVLWALRGMRPGVRWLILLALAVLSLALAQRLSASDPDAAFYLPFGRAWELLAGALLALAPGGRPGVSRGVAQALSALGLGAIVLAITLFSHDTPTPSVWTALPVLGAVLVIGFADGQTLVGRLLSTRIMVGIGLISYSAYLFHQPLQAFARVHALDDPGPSVLAAVGLLALPLGWLSWRFVEQPFRNRHGAITPARLWLVCGVGTALLLGLGFWGHVTRGWPDRLPPEVVAAARAATERDDQVAACRFTEDDTPTQPVDRCLDPGRPLVALIGDSHAMMYAPALRAALAAQGAGLYQISRNGCLPLPGFAVPDTRNGAGSCDRHVRAVWTQLGTLDPDVVVVSARWTMALQGIGFDNGAGGVIADDGHHHVDLRDPGRPLDDPYRIAEVAAAMGDQLRQLLKRHRVVLIYPTPEAGWDVPLRAGKLLLRGGQIDRMTTTADRARQRNAAVTAVFDAIESPRLYRVRPIDLLCDTPLRGRCRTMQDGGALYVDDNHLSQAGAAVVLPEILRQIALATGRPADSLQ